VRIPKQNDKFLACVKSAARNC